MNTGKIIPIAYPDTFVRYAPEFVQHKVFPLIGLGRRGFIKAGHALLLLINNTTGYIHYYDFGRYVTPDKKGRVRSEKTDVELHIPFKAQILDDGTIGNLEEILLWLEAHPEKTHGEGRMIASVCHEVDYEKALAYIEDLQGQGSVPYLTFSSTVGSNCSRLVTDTLIRSVTNKKIVKKLKRNNKFTPSPLGNVKLGSGGGPMYKVYKGKIAPYLQSVLKENLTNYFDWNGPKISAKKLPKYKGKAQLLEAIGASAYFEITATTKPDEYTITRYTAKFEKDFEGNFLINNKGFDIGEKYEFIFDCNCSQCHIKQRNSIYEFNIIKL